MSYATRTRTRIFFNLLLLLGIVGFASVVVLQLLDNSDGPDIELDYSFQNQLIERLSAASAGDRIDIPAGRFDLDQSLLIATAGIELRGAGPGKTLLSFLTLQGDKPAVQIDADGVQLSGISLLDVPTIAVLVSASDDVAIRDIETASPRSGVNRATLDYAVSVRRANNTIIENSQLRSAHDAGLYILDSENVLIRNNRISGNTLGIGLASSRSVDVAGNIINNNSMGILLMNLPGEVSAAGRNTRIFNNKIFENNRNNLYSSALISQRIYTGVGIHILGVDKVEIFANSLIKNNASNLVVFSENVSGYPDLLAFDPYAESIYVHDNHMESSGMAPSNLTNLRGVSLNLPYPDVLYDGQVNPLKVDGLKNPNSSFRFCMKNNRELRFTNLDIAGQYGGRSKLLEKVSCEHPPLPKPPITAANPEPEPPITATNAKPSAEPAQPAAAADSRETAR